MLNYSVGLFIIVYEWGERYPSSPDRPLMDVFQGVPRISPPKFVQDALGIASSSPESFGYSCWDEEVSMRQITILGARDEICVWNQCEFEYG